VICPRSRPYEWPRVQHIPRKWNVGWNLLPEPPARGAGLRDHLPSGGGAPGVPAMKLCCSPTSLPSWMMAVIRVAAWPPTRVIAPSPPSGQSGTGILSAAGAAAPTTPRSGNGPHVSPRSGGSSSRAA